MPIKPITIIAAVSQNRVIGQGGTMPWTLPEDLRHFMRTTQDCPVIMGRKTWESLPIKPLPRRTNIVLTRDPDFQAQSTEAQGPHHSAHTLEQALQCAQSAPGEAIMVIGGAQIYAQVMDIADSLIITHIEATFEGDALFPPIDPALFAITPGPLFHGPPPCRVLQYQRRKPPMHKNTTQRHTQKALAV